MTLADALYDSLGAWADADESGDLRKFCEALCSPVERIYARVQDTDDSPSWSTLLDPDLCPEDDLDYLAQFVGVTFAEGMTEAEKRTAIKTPTGFARGRPVALQAAIKRTLTGTKRRIIKERNPTPYSLYIRTLDAETPNPGLTEDVIRREQKPAGLVLDYEASTGYTYADLDADYSTYTAVDTDFSSYDEIATHTL